MNIFVPGKGNPYASIAIVGLGPGKDEELALEPFVGASGEFLESIFREVGIRRSEIWLTNVSKYRPPMDNLDFLGNIGISLQEQVDLLHKELKEINPNVIVALGDRALRVLTGVSGIRKHRGSIYHGNTGHKVIGTYHPAHILRSEGESSGYWERSLIVLDLQRAIEESRSPHLDLPSRTITICNTSEEIYRFAERTREYLSVDVETPNGVATIIGFANSPTDALTVDLSVERSENEQIHIIKCIHELLASWPIIGQNYKFDQFMLERMHIWTGNFFFDTMLAAHTLNPELPQGLDFLTSIYTREQYYKDTGRDFNPKKDNIKQFLIYNAKDAAVTYEIALCQMKELKEEGLHDFYFNFVHRLHFLYRDIEARGFLVDKEINAALRAKYEALKKKNAFQLELLAGFPVNPNSSTKDVPNFIYNHMKFPMRKGVGEDVLVALQANHAKTKEKVLAIDLVLDGRKIRKTLGTYLEAKTDADNRMRCSTRITGTENGRTSNSILRQPLRYETRGQAFQTLTKHGDIGADLRTQYIPSPGRILLEVDMSQAEARVVALLSKDVALLKMFEDGTDIHRVTASWVFGKNPDKISGVERYLGKKTRHAGNYREGKNRMMLDVVSESKRLGIKLEYFSEYKAGEILKAFHRNTPNLEKVYWKEIEEVLANERILRSPHGRRRIFLGRYDDDMIREGLAFIPQATVADQLKLAMLSVKSCKPNLAILVEAHDGLTCELEESELVETANLFKAAIERPIDFAECSLSRGVLVIPAEFKIGRKNYKELETWKLPKNC